MRSAVVLALVFAGALGSPSARAQVDPLAAARQLFAEAVADEDAKRYDVALEKFERVAAVKETANVRFRIATCLEALGRDTQAVAAYDKVLRLGADDAGAGDVVQEARTHIAAIEPRLSRLTVLLPAEVPPETEARLDEAPMDASALGTSIPVETGRHTLRVTAPGRTPFETAVMLPPGGRVTISVVLRPVEPAPSPTASTIGSGPLPPQPPPPPPSPSGPSTGTWLAYGIGGALGVGAVVSLVLRQTNVATLNRDCSSNATGGLTCPTTSASEVNAAHDAAQIEGPLAIGLGAGALVSLGVGTWLLLTPSSARSAWSATPVWTGDGARVSLSRSW